MARNKNEFVPERITWYDHCSYNNSQWRDLPTQQELEPMEIYSFGFVIKETKKFLIIVPHFSSSGNSFGEMLILKSCIKERKKVS